MAILTYQRSSVKIDHGQLSTWTEIELMSPPTSSKLVRLGRMPWWYRRHLWKRVWSPQSKFDLILISVKLSSHPWHFLPSLGNKVIQKCQQFEVPCSWYCSWWNWWLRTWKNSNTLDMVEAIGNKIEAFILHHCHWFCRNGYKLRTLGMVQTFKHFCFLCTVL